MNPCKCGLQPALITKKAGHNWLSISIECSCGQKTAELLCKPEREDETRRIVTLAWGCFLDIEIVD